MNLNYIHSIDQGNRSRREQINRQAVLSESRVLSPYAVLTAMFFGYVISCAAAKIIAFFA